MGWFENIFKGAKSKGQYDGTHREDSSSETEDIDHASLSEEGQNSKNESDEKDEVLARALQESLNVESSYQHSNGNSSDGHDDGNNSDGGNENFWICAGCNQPINNYFEYVMFENSRYHKGCYQKSYGAKCDVCRNIFLANDYKVQHPFWFQKTCPRHEHDGTRRCYSCRRLESYNTTYIALNDGRNICLECLDSAIMDTKDCQPLYLRIQEFYEGINMEVKEEVPLLLVDKEGIKDALGDQPKFETRGLCLPHEHTVLHISRGPRFGDGNQMTDIETEPYELKKHCQVTGIVILYGLPRLLTGHTIVHELMHVWLRLNGYRYGLDVEEGICQVIAHKWLESQINLSTSAERKLGEYFRYEIAMDTTEKYGNSFRTGQRAVLQYRIEYTLDHFRTTGCFPM